MKRLLSGVVAGLTLLVCSSALAQLAPVWTPSSGYVLSDGGNIPYPQYPVLSAGHANWSGGVPTVGTFNAAYGTATAISVTGSDNSMIINFTTGTGGAEAAQAANFVVTLASAYASTAYQITCSFAQAAGTPGVSAFYAVPTTAGTFTVYNTVGFTPATTTAYKFQCTTSSAGANF